MDYKVIISIEKEEFTASDVSRIRAKEKAATDALLNTQYCFNGIPGELGQYVKSTEQEQVESQAQSTLYSISENQIVTGPEIQVITIKEESKSEDKGEDIVTDIPESDLCKDKEVKNVAKCQRYQDLDTGILLKSGVVGSQTSKEGIPNIQKSSLDPIKGECLSSINSSRLMDGSKTEALAETPIEKEIKLKAGTNEVNTGDTKPNAIETQFECNIKTENSVIPTSVVGKTATQLESPTDEIKMGEASQDKGKFATGQSNAQVDLPKQQALSRQTSNHSERANTGNSSKQFLTTGQTKEQIKVGILPLLIWGGKGSFLYNWANIFLPPDLPVSVW